MKRASNCIIRTINLSDPRTCMKPKIRRKIPPPDLKEPCPRLQPGSTTYWTPRPVAVRVCTWRDVKRTCSPKLCDCSQKEKPSGNRVLTFLWFLVKGGVVVGLICWAKCEGIRKTSAEMEELYYRMIQLVFPPKSNERGPDQVNQLEHQWSAENTKRSLAELYNRAIFRIINFLAFVPLKIQERMRRVGRVEKRPTTEISNADNKDHKSDGDNAITEDAEE